MYREEYMRSSAHIIQFREQDRRQPVDAVDLDEAPGARSKNDGDTVQTANLELARLIQELRAHIPNYARI